MTSSTAHSSDESIPVWLALADLFAGKELQDDDFDYIARRLRATGLPMSRIEAMLWNDMFPVFGANLGSLAIPEMEGWSDAGIVDAMQKHLRTPPALLTRLTVNWHKKRGRHVLHARWKQVQRRLISS